MVSISNPSIMVFIIIPLQDEIISLVRGVSLGGAAVTHFCDEV